jgi:hypothetical protein
MGATHGSVLSSTAQNMASHGNYASQATLASVTGVQCWSQPLLEESSRPFKHEPFLERGSSRYQLTP